MPLYEVQLMRRVTQTVTVYVEAEKPQDITESVIRDADSVVVTHADNVESWDEYSDPVWVLNLDRLEDNSVIHNVVLKLPARKK